MAESDENTLPRPVLEPGQVVRSVAIWLLLALLGTAGVLVVLLVLIARADWWEGLLAAFVLNLLAGVVSLVPLWLGLAWGIQGAVAGYFVGMGLRLFVVLAGALLLVQVGDYPAAPTFVLAVPLYLALLGAESASLGRLLWRADRRTGEAPDSISTR